MSNREKEQVIALAAVFQAAELVTVLAKTGQVDQDSLQPLINSVLTLDAPTTQDIYGGQWDCQSNLAMGRRIACQALGKDRNSLNPNTLRYALSMVHLESKLAKHSDMLSLIGQRIQQIADKQSHYDSVLHENMMAAISGLYQDSLSKLPFRIQVHGDSRYLQQAHIANQVRAILLAGVRGAMLWRQLGGKRWHLIFKRKALLTALDARN